MGEVKLAEQRQDEAHAGAGRKAVESTGIGSLLRKESNNGEAAIWAELESAPFASRHIEVLEMLAQKEERKLRGSAKKEKKRAKKEAKKQKKREKKNVKLARAVGSSSP